MKKTCPFHPTRVASVRLTQALFVCVCVAMTLPGHAQTVGPAVENDAEAPNVGSPVDVAVDGELRTNEELASAVAAPAVAAPAVTTPAVTTPAVVAPAVADPEEGLELPSVEPAQRSQCDTACACACAETNESAEVDLDEGREAYWWISGQLHSAILSDIVDRSSNDLTFGEAITVGRRWPSGMGGFLQLDVTSWNEAVLSEGIDDPFDKEYQTSVNLAIGVEKLWLNNRVRSSFAAGATMVMRRTRLDIPGTIGGWIDFRPVGLRFVLSSRIALAIDPLTLTVLLPVTSGIPLILIHFRTAVAIEFNLGGGFR